MTSRSPLSLGLLPLISIWLLCAVVAAQAQPNRPISPSQPLVADDPMIGQLVDSRRGYVLRIPTEAILDSSRSGWNPTKLFERRVYVIPGAGEIRVTVAVGPQTTPDTAVDEGAHIYVPSDSATPHGMASVRTFYLPTRSVRIEIIPSSITMKKYIDAREIIFRSFRWKPGANRPAFDTDPPAFHPPPSETAPRRINGGRE